MRFLSNLLSSVLGTFIALGLLAFFGFLFILALAASSSRTPTVSSGSVLHITLDGSVPEVIAHDPLSQAFAEGARFDLRGFKESMRKAAVDSRIDAVRLDIKDIDAAWATLQEMRSALVRFKESGKPLIASSADHGMAEAEFFLASAADSLFAQPEAPFEFNGFALTSSFYEGTLNKLNIEPRVFRAGRYKSAVEPFTRSDLSAENEEQLRSILETQNDIFMSTVAESRGLSPDTLNALASENAILNAENAVAAGLIDALLYHDEVDALIKDRLNYEDDIEDVSLSSYTRVPASEAGLERGDEGDIAVVYAVGGITSGKSGPSQSPLLGNNVVGAETFRDAMVEARESDEVKAVVLRVNSPGGQVAPAEAMWREVKLTTRQKPVIVSMGDLAASAGYWISAPADTIVADPLTLTGSIGVFSVLFDTRNFFNEKLGITFDAVQTSPLADIYSSIGDLSEEERQLLQYTTQDVYQAFLRHVAQGRNLSVAGVDSIGQGRVWTGREALENNLVDVLGGLDEAVELAAERAGLEAGTYRLRTLPRPRSFFERFAQSLEARAAHLWMNARTSRLERNLLEHLHTLQRLKDMHGTVQARLPFIPDIR